MRRLILSLFLGFGASFVAWAASFAVIDLAALETTELKEHQVVVVAAAVLLILGFLVFSRSVEPPLSLLSAAAGCALLWDVRALPEGSGYSTEYWSAVVVTTLAFMIHAFMLNRDYFRSRRTRR